MKSDAETKKREKLPMAYACPFRENHFCKNCELFDVNLKACIFKAININLGKLATGNLNLGEDNISKD